MSNTKGFEVKFRGHCIQMSERQLSVMDVKIKKESDLFSISVGGLMNDKKTHCTLCYEYGLREGNEITIERKHLKHSSAPVTMPDVYDMGKEPPGIAHGQHRLALFYDLEAYLTEKGLIE